jgi:ABC-type metal ion transport system substrate-binding protein
MLSYYKVANEVEKQGVHVKLVEFSDWNTQMLP